MSDPGTPTPSGEMLRRTYQRAQQMRRRRRAALLAAFAAIVAAAIAVPLTVGGGSTKLNVVGGSSTTFVPSPAPTVPSTTTSASPLGSPTSLQASPAPPVPSTTTSTSPSSSAPTTTVLPSCAANQLSGQLTGQSGTAGGVAYTLVLTNTGPATCTLYGYPGVSYVAPNGNTVGAPAIRSPRPVQAVALAPGGSAQAPLLETDSLNYPQPSCQLTAFAGLRVYPPGERASLVIPQTGQACANTADNVLQVGPMQPG